MSRERPIVLSTRVGPHERAIVRALAEIEGRTMSQVVHALLIPAARDKLTEYARETAVVKVGR